MTHDPMEAKERLLAEKRARDLALRPARLEVEAALERFYKQAPLSSYLSSDGDAYHVVAGNKEVGSLRLDVVEGAVRVQVASRTEMYQDVADVSAGLDRLATLTAERLLVLG